MVHTENNKKKNHKKKCKEEIFSNGNLYFKFFYQKRDTKRNDKSRYTKDIQNITK